MSGQGLASGLTGSSMGVLLMRPRRQRLRRQLLVLVGRPDQGPVVDSEVRKLDHQAGRPVHAAAVHLEAQLPGTLRMRIFDATQQDAFES